MTDFSDDEISNVVRGSFGSGAASAATANIDVNPDQTARAYQLEKATGIPASVINGDLEGFESQAKAGMANQIISRNQYIAKYVNSHPLASQLSNDDYGNLETSSQSLSGVQKWLKSDSISRATAQGWNAGAGAEGIGSWAYLDNEGKFTQDSLDHPLLAATAATLGLPLEVPLRTVSGIFGAAVGAGSQAIQDATGIDTTSAREALMDPGFWMSIGVPLHEHGIRMENNAKGLEVIDQSIKDVQASLTRERAPELFHDNFVKEHLPDAKMEISGEAALKLYGDKAPEIDDGILGWVPDIQKQLDNARETGADITVPMSQWISTVDPAVHKALHDDLRVTPWGITAREATESVEADKAKADAAGPETQPPLIPPYIEEPVPTIRAGTGLEPLFALGDRKLELKRLASEGSQFGLEQGFHDFDMINEKGESVGTINLSEQKGGKDLYVEMINGLGEYYNPNNFGPALMRSILRQLKTEFPNAETISGHRVSGAREAAGVEMTQGMAKIKFSELESDPASIKQFSELVGGAWLEHRPGLESYVKPTELLNTHEANLISAVDAEINRIVGPNRVISAPVSDIRRGSDQGPIGFFHPQPEYAKSVLAYSLNSFDPVGVVRHESIHALRHLGLLEPREWKVLEKAAFDEKWLDKYDINERYGTLDYVKKLEEGVAEAFRHWSAEQDSRAGTPRTVVDAIFEKLRDFLATIKEHIQHITGKSDVTFEDLFSKIDSGEIAQRGGKPEAVGLQPAMALPESMKMSREEMEDAQVNVANDRDITGQKPTPSYKGAVENQAIKRIVDKNSDVRSQLAWRKLAEQEGHTTGLTDRPNALSAARKYSEGGKTTVVIREDGRRIVYHNGMKVARDPLLDRPSFAEAPLERGTGTEVTPPFRAAKEVGMTIADYNNYMKLIEARQKSDLAKSTARITREQTKRQSDKWKADSEAMRPEVVAGLNARPDIAADKFLATGELFGKKLENSYKLDRESIPKEIRDQLPDEYLTGRTGVKPDEVAHLFGYPTGDMMIASLAKLNAVRKASGLGRDRFMRQLVSTEIAQRMEIEHGFLKKNIQQDALDQVLSENQLDLLHEETHRLGQMAGSSVGNLTRDQLFAGIKEKFDSTLVGHADSNKWLRAVGKLGQNAETHLLAGKPADAFLAKQAQYYGTMYAKLALDVEKAKAKLDKAAKAFKKTEIKNIEPEYLNHIQNLLQQAGYKVGRSVDNIRENLDRRQKTVMEFANDKFAESFGMRDIPIADVIVDGAVKPVEEMTTHDFMAYKSTIDALIKNAKDEQKIYREGETADRKQLLTDMQDIIKDRFDERILNLTPTRMDKVTAIPKSMLASITAKETFFNRMGGRDPGSVFNKYIVYPLASAANRKSSLQREFSKIYRSFGELEDKDKLVQTPLIDPRTGKPFENFTRGNVMQMIRNAGNKGNWETLAKGYGADPAKLMDWLVTASRAEDWTRAQKEGDELYGELVKLADNEYEHIHGITVDKVKLTPFTNLHGTFDGWYHPLIKAPDIEGRAQIRGGAYDDANFGHITTANGYTKKRTGAAYPVDLNPDMMPVRINQMIHDISFRSVILEANKLFRDPSLSNTITARYGAEYNGKNFLLPYLRDIAGQESIPAQAISDGNRISEFLRQNVIGTYIGFNPSTVFKHGPTALYLSMKQVGPMNFLSAMRDMYQKSPDINLANHEFAMKWSEELQRRERHWQDTLFGAHSEIEGAGPWSSPSGFRNNIIEKGSWAVAKSDMFSAKPTWLAAYRDALGEQGMSHGAAIDYADAQVRMAHGSTAITNQPGLVLGTGAAHKWMTSVYGFFGTMMQRRLELAHDVSDTLSLAKDGEIRKAAGNVPGLLFDTMAYVIWPTMVEEMVTGITTDDHRGWGTHLASAAFLGMSSSVLFLRDVAHALSTGQDPSIGLMNTALGDLVKGVKAPFKHDAWTKARMGKTVGDTLTAFGHATGMAPKTLDNALHFGIDLVNGVAHPKSLGDWYRGTVKGKTQAREEK